MARKTRTRVATIAELSKRLLAIERIGYEALQSNARGAQRDFEIADKEAKLAATKRSTAKRYRDETAARARSVEVQHKRAEDRLQRTLDDALASRSGDLKHVPKQHQHALEYVKELQREGDREATILAVIQEIKSASSFAGALRAAGVRIQTSIPPEREREWTSHAATQRLQLIAAVLRRRESPLNALQQEIIRRSIEVPQRSARRTRAR